MFPEDERDLCWDEPFRAALEPTGLIDYTIYSDLSPCDTEHFSLPLGAVVAVARLLSVISAEDATPDEPERSFGDFSEERWAWLLADVVALKAPIPCRGSLGLWTLPPEIERQL